MTIRVGIGDIARSLADEPPLSALGLGSCVAVILLERRSGVVALAHVFLPAPPTTPDLRVAAELGASPGRFATTAVPELVRIVRDVTPSLSLVEAVLVGGGALFARQRRMNDVGRRNEIAVRRMLAEAGIGIIAADTGGETGRSVRVLPGCCEVLVRGNDRTERRIDIGDSLRAA